MTHSGRFAASCSVLLATLGFVACESVSNPDILAGAPSGSGISSGGGGSSGRGPTSGSTMGATGDSAGARTGSSSSVPTSGSVSEGNPGSPGGGGGLDEGGTPPPAEAGPMTFGDSGITDPGSAGDGDFTIGPSYTADPLVSPQGAPMGSHISFIMQGSESQIYPGINGNYMRHVGVYVPKQYVPGTPAPFIVTQDALGEDLIPTVLDNLINAKQLPNIVALFVDNGGGDAQGSERGLEYDTVSGLFAEFVQTEVLPRVITEVKTQLQIDLQFTSDPQGRATLGGSSGGAASFSMAWWHPDLFNRVLTYSGTYVNQVTAASPFPHGCWVYHDVDPYSDAGPNGLIVQDCQNASGNIASSNPGPCDTPLSQTTCQAATGCTWNTSVNKPLRVWLESAQNDLGAGGAPSSYRNFDLANQRMAASLQARGYHYVYNHALNAGHEDPKVISQTLPSALLWLWRGYPIP
jgi:enterochelin esterase family protein